MIKGKALSFSTVIFGIGLVLSKAAGEDLVTHPDVPLSRDVTKKFVANGFKAMSERANSGEAASVKTIFIGDSLTKRWTHAGEGADVWRESFSDAWTFSMGGDRTEHVLFRLLSQKDGGLGLFDNQELQPDTIILMIGTNNLFSYNAEQIVTGISAVVHRIQELRPDARLILCSVLPARNKNFNTGKIIPVNSVIRNLKGINFLDLFPAFSLEDGVTYNKEYYIDGLHLSPEGYRLWRDYLVQYMNL